MLSLNQQITNFEVATLPDLRALLRGATTVKKSRRIKGRDFFDGCYLPKSLFVIGTGGNDYLLNYFSPAKSADARPQLSEFTRALVTKLSLHLQVFFFESSPGNISAILINAHAHLCFATVHFVSHCNNVKESTVPSTSEI